MKVALVMKNIDRGNYCPNNPYLDKAKRIGYGVEMIEAPRMVSYWIFAIIVFEFFSMHEFWSWWKTALFMVGLAIYILYISNFVAPRCKRTRHWLRFRLYNSMHGVHGNINYNSQIQ